MVELILIPPYNKKVGYKAIVKFMSLNIKNEKAHQMAKELSKMMGVSMTAAVMDAIERRIEAERERKKQKLEKILRTAESASKLPIYDTRTPDEIIGYNDQGHFDKI